MRLRNSHAVQFAPHEFSSALDRSDPSVHDQFGTEVGARESDAREDDREENVIKNHVKHPAAGAASGA